MVHTGDMTVRWIAPRDVRRLSAGAIDEDVRRRLLAEMVPIEPGQ